MAGSHERAEPHSGSRLQLMAEAPRLTGHNEESIPLYERALGILRQAGDHEGTGVALVNLSLVFESMGKWDQMEASNREALQAFKIVNDRVNSSICLSNIADVLALRGRLQEASDMYQQSWKLMESTGMKRTEFPHIPLAFLWLMQGDPGQARHELDPQITTLREFGEDPWSLASALTLRGDIQREENQLADARASYQEALQTLKKANAASAAAKVSLARLEMDEGRFAEAEALLRESITEFEKDKSAGDEIDGYAALGRALLMRGDVTGAQEAVSRAFNLANSRKFPLLRLSLRILQAQTTAAASSLVNRVRSNASPPELRAIAAAAKQLKLYKIEIEARLALANILMDTNPQEARSQLRVLASDAHKHGFERLANQTQERQQASLR
jgi:tetratricopeptide (TPR) repeat protein